MGKSEKRALKWRRKLRSSWPKSGLPSDPATVSTRGTGRAVGAVDALSPTAAAIPTPLAPPRRRGCAVVGRIMSEATEAWASVSKAWLHGLAYLRANPGAIQGSGTPSYDQVVRHLHGPSGLWSKSLDTTIQSLNLPLGAEFEYDPLRSCAKWNQFTCFPAPKMLNSLALGIPPSPTPVLILEVRPFLGASTIALANALSYAQRDGFVLSVDTWRSIEGVAGIKQAREVYAMPQACETDSVKKTGVCDEATYYQFLRNVATESVGGRPGEWVPKGYKKENNTKRVVPLPMLAAKAKGAAHWLGTRGWRPALVYVNPPGTADFKQELELSWRILACGGTIAGSGYRLPDVQAAVREFSEKRKLPVDIRWQKSAVPCDNAVFAGAGPPETCTINGHHATQTPVCSLAQVEATFWRAAGTKYEQAWPWEHTDEFEGRMAMFNKSNFSSWAVHNKPCKPGAEDPELPTLEAGAEVPAEYTLGSELLG